MVWADGRAPGTSPQARLNETPGGTPRQFPEGANVKAAPVPARLLAWGPAVSTALALLLPDPVPAQQPTEAQGGPDPAAAPLAAPAAEGELPALRLAPDLGIDLNGRLDEEVWAHAPAITDFTQQEPVEGAPPTREMEIRVLYDDERPLYRSDGL